MTNYQKGRNFEYKIKKLLEKQNYLVIRSAGSHSFADLIAIRKNQILFLQLSLNFEKQKISDLKKIKKVIAKKVNVKILYVFKKKKKIFWKII